MCHVGYSGEDCGQEEPPASACPGGCGPRELCSAGQCVCVEGFRGPDCAIQTCPGDCRGRGECREGSCVCQDGYAGEDCGEGEPTACLSMLGLGLENWRPMRKPESEAEEPPDLEAG